MLNPERTNKRSDKPEVLAKTQTLLRFPVFWALQIGGWCAYGLYRHLVDPHFFPRGYLYLAIAFSITSLLRLIYRRLWLRSVSFIYVGVAVVLCSLAAGFLYLLTAKFLFVLLGVETYLNQAWYIHLADALRYSLIHNKTFVFLSWSALYFGIKYWQDMQAQRERVLRAAAFAKEAQLEMLRYQLNPHFLFNSLNSISALIREAPERAESIVNELSDFLRYSLLNSAIQDVPLRDEVEAVRNYLSIQQIRFEEKLKVQFNISPETEDIHVPCFLMQPLVENAIKFGMNPKQTPLQVRVSSVVRGTVLHLEIANTGEWHRPAGERSGGLEETPPGTGIGIRNVRQRLEHLFAGKQKFEVFEENGWVRAVIEITLGRVKNGE